MQKTIQGLHELSIQKIAIMKQQKRQPIQLPHLKQSYLSSKFEVREGRYDRLMKSLSKEVNISRQKDSFNQKSQKNKQKQNKLIAQLSKRVKTQQTTENKTKHHRYQSHSRQPGLTQTSDHYLISTYSKFNSQKSRTENIKILEKIILMKPGKEVSREALNKSFREHELILKMRKSKSNFLKSPKKKRSISSMNNDIRK